jgi:hypothetical protein
MSPPPAPTQSHSTTSRTNTYTYVHNKRLILSKNPQAHTGRILGGADTPPYNDSLWPYYVLNLNKWCQDNDDKTGHTQKTPTRQEFEAKTTSQQYQEFAKIGLVFNTSEELLLQILPIGQEISQLYTGYEIPEIQMAQRLATHDYYMLSSVNSSTRDDRLHERWQTTRKLPGQRPNKNILNPTTSTSH